jgi:hypothetical protein
MIKKINLIFLVLITLGFAANTGAVLIDFRSSEFHIADWEPSEYFGSYGLTVEAAPGGARLYHDTTDGFGVRYSYENDEIEGPDERLHLSFDSAVGLTGFLVTDLFNEPFNGGGGNYLERGSYSFDNVNWTHFAAQPSQTPGTNGELYISLSSSPPTITDLWFMSLGWEDCRNEDHEFSVAQIEVNAVPEPASMLFLGFGMIAVAGFGRKKFLKKKK